jgi:WD40 repeat protein
MDNSIMLWNLERRRTPSVIPNVVLDTFHHVGHPVFSPDSRILATPASTGGIVLWDVDTCQAVARLETDFLPVAFSPDGGTLLARNECFNALQQWELSTSTLSGATELSTTEMSAISAEVYADAFSYDRKMYATSHRGELRIILRSAVTGEFLFALQDLEPTRSLAFSPDGSLLATGHWNGMAELWDMTTHDLVFAPGGFRNTVSSFAFSADGRLLAASSFDSSIKVCDIGTKQELMTLTGHKSAVGPVAFSTDGKTLASACDDGFIKLWNLATGREVITFKAAVGARFINFSPDGRTLAAGGGSDGIVHLWRAPTLSQIEAADKVNRPQ